VQVWINGEQRELGGGARVPDALDELGAPATGVAVAVDGEVVPRAQWESFALAEHARVEVLTAMQGG
jgi:sulfur carrier protein